MEIKGIVSANSSRPDTPRPATADPVTVTPRSSPAGQLAGLYDSARIRAKAIADGDRVREQVRVQSVAPGIIRTTIKPLKQNEAPLAGDTAPLVRIQGLLKEKSEYTRLTVVGGAATTSVSGTAEGALPAHPEALTKNTAASSAVINGGYFIHKPGLIGDDGEHISNIGVPIGPTSHREDHQPISGIWKQYYGQVRINEQAGLCSGPLLARNGKQEAVPFSDEAFLYRPDGKNENELNRYGGAMTPCGDPIERSAISVNMSEAGTNGDVVMHTLTAGGSRTNGATMADWQKLTQIGADSAQGHAHSRGIAGNASTLALDGGGSTYLGIRDENGLTTLVHGRGGISGDAIRPTPNVIISTPARGKQHAVQTDGSGGLISIHRAPQGES